MKKFSVAAFLLFSLSTAIVVSAVEKHEKEVDYGKYAVVTTDNAGSHFDVTFIDDAFVPVVQSFHMKHIESVSFLSEGYCPPTQAKARAPTDKLFNEKARDKLRCPGQV